MAKGNSLQVRFGGGLSSTLARRSIAPGALAESWNATGEREQAEARPGFAIIQKLIGSSGTIYGMGYGRFDSVEEYIVVGKPATDTLASVYVLTVGATWPYTVTTYGQSGGVGATAIGDWQFTQFGRYVYAVNPTAGLYRRKIGEASTVEKWQKVNTKYRYYVAGSVGLDELGTRPWNDTFDVEAVYQTHGTLSASSSTIMSDGSWKISQTPNGSSPLNGYSWFVAAISDNAIATAGSSTGVSFETCRYASIQLGLEYDTSDVRPNEAPVFTVNQVAFPPICYVSTVATSSMPSTTAYASTWASPWKKVPIKEAVIDRDNLLVTLDFDALAVQYSITLASIKKIAFGINIKAGNVWTMTASAMQLGGVFLNKPRNTAPMTSFPFNSYPNELKPLEYAVQYYNSTSTAESSASMLTLPVDDGYGIPHPYGSLPVGNRAKIAYSVGVGALAPANFDKIRIWRKRNSDSGKWYLLTEVSNADGTFIDSYEDALLDHIAWPTSTTPRTDTSAFTSVDQALTPSCVWAWKGHLILGVGTEVYFSYGGAPDQYVPPARDLPQLFDVDDPTLGRTLYMAADQSDTVLGGVSDDMNYLIGDRGIYVMVGDSAIDATPPRLLPGSKGTFGKRSFCKFRGGILAANEEGLYWHRGVRALAGGSDSIYEFENLTSDIERHWKWLTSDSDATGYMVVREWQNEIYCIVYNKFLKLNRQGKWENGAWDSDAIMGDAYTGSGGSQSSGGIPYGDDPGAGSPFPAGPYTNPNELPSSPISNPIHGVAEKWKVGIMPTGVDYWPGENNVPWDVGNETGHGGGMARGGGGSPPDHRIVEAFGVSGRGLRAMSQNGTFIQVSYTEAGVAYANDAGYPIEWFMQTGDFEAGYPYRFGLDALFINSMARVEDSEPLRIILTSLDGTNLFEQQYFDVESRTFWPDTKAIRPGSRWNVIIAGRSASQIGERLELVLAEAGTKGN